jgi:hypothetical protein
VRCWRSSPIPPAIWSASGFDLDPTDRLQPRTRCRSDGDRGWAVEDPADSVRSDAGWLERAAVCSSTVSTRHCATLLATKVSSARLRSDCRSRTHVRRDVSQPEGSDESERARSGRGAAVWGKRSNIAVDGHRYDLAVAHYDTDR